MNMIRQCFIAGLATAAMMISATSVKADQYAQTTFSGNQAVDLAGNVWINTTAGTFTTTIANNSGLTGGTAYTSYCVDLFHYTGSVDKLDNLVGTSGLTGPLPLTNVYGTGSTDVGTSPWQLAGFGRAAWLVDTFGGSLTTDAQRALLQIAVWKADYSSQNDTANFANVLAGTEYVTNTYNFHSDPGGLTSTQISTIDGYLAASVAAGGGTYATASATWVDFSNYNGNHTQDQLIAVPVPEPSALAIAGLGALGMIGYGTRRRKNV